MDKAICLGHNFKDMDPEFINNLFDSISHLDYVVMRNWRELPNMDYEHPDLDIMVSVADFEAMKLLVPEWVDLRNPTDGYLPHALAYKMILERRNLRNFYIPSPETYFLSLYYHAQVHKKSMMPYVKELRRAFFEWIRPVKCEDHGVGFYDTD